MHENPCCVLFKGKNPSWREYYLLIWEQHAPTILPSRKPMRLSYFFPFKGLTTSTSTGLRGLKFIVISTQMLYHQILDIPIEQKCLQAWLLLPAIHIHPFPTYHGGHSLAIVFLSSTPPNSVAIQKTPMWQSPHHGQNIWTKCHHRWIISENCFIRIFLKQQAGVRGLFFGNSC